MSNNNVIAKPEGLKQSLFVDCFAALAMTASLAMTAELAMTTSLAMTAELAITN
jgi:hypothetical protein